MKPLQTGEDYGEKKEKNKNHLSDDTLFPNGGWITWRAADTV